MNSIYLKLSTEKSLSYKDEENNKSEEKKENYFNRLIPEIIPLLFSYSEFPWKEWKRCCLLSHYNFYLFTNQSILTQLFKEKIQFQFGLLNILKCAQLANHSLKDFHICQAGSEMFSRLDLDRLVAQNPNLEYLSFENSDLHNEDLKWIAESFKNLKSLNLKSCKNINDEGLAHLQMMTLRSLSLSNCYKITNKGLAFLQPLTYLESLDLTRCNQLTDDGLAHLKGLSSLQFLDLNSCWKITDTGLTHLQKLISLQSLVLVNCRKITDDGLAHLQVLTSLQFLNLNSCWKITEEGRAKLTQFIPFLKFESFT